MFDARENNTKFSKKINDEWTTLTVTNDVYYESKKISNRVCLLQNEILLLDKQQYTKYEEIKMQQEIYEILRKYERRIQGSVRKYLEYLQNSVESQTPLTQLFKNEQLTKECTKLLSQKDAEIDDELEYGHKEIKELEMKYENKDYISRHKKQIFGFDKKQTIKLYKEYVTKHPDQEPKTFKQRHEFSFWQVQIPVFEAFFEYKWKTKRAYEIDLEVQRTKTFILNQVMELSKFFFEGDYHYCINREICGLFYRSLLDIGNLESYVTPSCDSVKNKRRREEATNLANQMKEKLLAAKQLAGHEPRQDCKIGTQNIYYVDVLN